MQMTEPGEGRTSRAVTIPIALAGTVFRPARPDDLATCGRIWREAINDYRGPLGQAEVPDELAPIGRLHAHTRATDPERFVVAAQGPAGAERLVGFGSAVLRGGRLWFLSMLFVRPEAQGRGLGRALLERLLPEPGEAAGLATAIDSLQPISAALYAQYGLVPRLPVLNLAGTIRRHDALPPLPSGIVAVPFETIAGGPPDGPGHRRLTEVVGRLDRELLGVEHPEDHRFLRGEGRRGFLYEAPDGTAVGYGYAGEVGRVGPIAVRDSGLLEAVVGHLTAAVPARGATAIWATGAADRLVPTLLAAGLRIEEFPVLLCWDRQVTDFTRYLPISPGLL